MMLSSRFADVSGDIDGIGSFVYGVMVVKNSGHSAISFDRDDYHLYVSGFLSKKPEPQWSPAVATCTVFLPPNGEIEYKVYWFFDAYIPVDDLNRSVVQFVPPTSDRPPCRF